MNSGLRPQCDENTTFSNHALYLGLPCCKDDFNSCPNIPSSLVFQRSTKETFWISTQLSSTKLTQNGKQPEVGQRTSCGALLDKCLNKLLTGRFRHTL